MKYVVSACLLGDTCKYNGGNNYNEKVCKFLNDKKYIKVCPECLGELGIPRLPSEIIGDKVVNSSNVDVTLNYKKGAEETLKICQNENINCAIMKSRSPSCGCGQVYDGTFSKKLVDGDGITVRLLKKHGIKVLSEEDINEY